MEKGLNRAGDSRRRWDEQTRPRMGKDWWQCRWMPNSCPFSVLTCLHRLIWICTTRSMLTHCGCRTYPICHLTLSAWEETSSSPKSPLGCSITPSGTTALLCRNLMHVYVGGHKIPISVFKYPYIQKPEMPTSFKGKNGWFELGRILELHYSFP